MPTCTDGVCIPLELPHAVSFGVVVEDTNQGTTPGQV